MKELNFDTGVITYNINGVCKININPSDSVFINRLAEVFDKIEALGEEYSKNINLENPKQVFELCEKRNAEARSIIDGFFGVPVCDALFNEMDVFATADGLPLWQNLFFAVAEELETNALEQKAKAKTRIDKYTAKYRK